MTLPPFPVEICRQVSMKKKTKKNRNFIFNRKNGKNKAEEPLLLLIKTHSALKIVNLSHNVQFIHFHSSVLKTTGETEGILVIYIFSSSFYNIFQL